MLGERMKIIIIGAVAAGTSAATKARRNNEEAQITIYEKDSDISYSGCGLPYFIGEEVESIETLRPRDPQFFKENHNVDVFIEHEVISIDANKKEVVVKNLKTQEVFKDHYDKLVIATGATSFIPPINGVNQEHVFSLRNVQDAIKMKNYIDHHLVSHAIIVGTGFIGLELLENFKRLEIDTTLIELAPQITPNLDEDMAQLLENKLLEKEVKILKETTVAEIFSDHVVLNDNQSLRADLVVIATGVKPNTKLAESIGVELGVTQAIKVNDQLETNIEDVYACGDCIETNNLLTNKPHYRPLGSTANKTGRICGDVITGGKLRYQGNLGTGIYRVFDLAIASSGLTEKQVLELGYEIEVIHNTKPSHAEYMGGQKMIIKAIADKKTRTLLGVQIIGNEGVDKRLDVLVTLMTYKVPVEDFFHLDLGYAPPFSTTKDPVHYTGMILDNILSKEKGMMTSSELRKLDKDKVTIIDARSKQDVERKGMIEGAKHIALKDLRKMCDQLDHDKITITYCNSGTTANAAQNVLLNRGFNKVYNLSGGHSFYVASENKKDD